MILWAFPVGDQRGRCASDGPIRFLFWNQGTWILVKAVRLARRARAKRPTRNVEMLKKKGRPRGGGVQSGPVIVKAALDNAMTRKGKVVTYGVVHRSDMTRGIPG